MSTELRNSAQSWYFRTFDNSYGFTTNFVCKSVCVHASFSTDLLVLLLTSAMAQQFDGDLHDALARCVKEIQRCGQLDNAHSIGDYRWRKWCDNWCRRHSHDLFKYSCGFLADFITDVSSRRFGDDDDIERRKRKLEETWSEEADKHLLVSHPVSNFVEYDALCI